MRGFTRVGCLVAALLAGCDTPQAAVDEVTCTDLCRCLSGLEATQERCTAQCMAQLAPVPDACSDCVGLHAGSCTEIINECFAGCVSQPTPLEGDPE